MDIIHTIPKAKEPDLEQYLDKIGSNSRHFYQTSRQPTQLRVCDRCWIVHDGYVRGYFYVTDVFYSEVPVRNPIKDYDSPPGWYVEKGSTFNRVDPEPMTGFQGWRYRR